MAESTVEVTFRLFVDKGIELKEKELEQGIEKYGAQLRAEHAYEGAIDIRVPEEPELEIEDELPALVKNFCFSAIPDLLAEKNVVIRYHSYYGYLRLDPEGWRILVSGDGLPTVRIPRNKLLPAIYDCGQRFIRFLELLKGEKEDSELEGLISFLARYGEKAREALENMKPKPGEPD
jgi:hypothetical protein